MPTHLMQNVLIGALAYKEVNSLGCIAPKYMDQLISSDRNRTIGVVDLCSYLANVLWYSSTSVGVATSSASATVLVIERDYPSTNR